MTYLIFSFRSRSQSMRFYGELRKFTPDCSLINTPREVSLGCGLSVKMHESSYANAVGLLGRLNLNTFLGAFRVTANGSVRKTERLFF